MGIVKIILHRPICGVIKTLAIGRDAVGNRYANFMGEVGLEPVPGLEKNFGIEVGLESFVTQSNGQIVDHPRFCRRDEVELTKVSRKLSKDEKG